MYLQASERSGARVESMASTRERLINTVIHDKPKMLIGLSQKACSGYRGLCVPCHGHRALPVERAGLTFPVTEVKHGKPVILLQG